LSSDEIYRVYWGFSEDPQISEVEFEQQQFKSLIDKINRVPLADSEAADRGTAFNEIVDCMIAGRKSKKMKIERVYRTIVTGDITCNPDEHPETQDTDEVFALRAEYNNHVFIFPTDICREFARYFKGAVSQVYTEAILPTRYGDVLLYGFVDELTPDCVHDIKLTVKAYKAGKFRRGWQHVVYPYCLNKSGSDVHQFEYDIAEFNGKSAKSYIEYYTYDEERDIPKLTEQVEAFIEFLEQHRDIITDKKIFNNHKTLNTCH
jgi:hypothetical protein